MSRIRHYGVLALTGLGVTALVVLSPKGAGAAPESESFSTPGAHEFAVPGGVTRLTIDVYGAAGGSSGVAPPVPGGLGGRLRVELPVQPGETLLVTVGGAGGDYEGGGPGSGGVNGGGDGGGVGAGGGGGASDVRRGGVGLTDRIVVAGGGGAGGGENACESAVGGSGGGLTPTAGGSIAGATGGEPGGPSEGGAGGTGAFGGQNGQNGVVGNGGAGAGNFDGYAAGGGGGGWYGGGGGGSNFYSAAGGGGSSVADDGAEAVFAEDGVRAGDGLVVIEWEPPATTTTTTTTTSTTTTTTTTTVPVRDPDPRGSFGPDAGGGTVATVASPGGTLTINSQDWLPGSVVTVTMHSEPVELGRVTANSLGAFVATFDVPDDASIGQHRVVLSGTGASGSPASVDLTVDLVAGSATAGSTPFAPAPLKLAC